MRSITVGVGSGLGALVRRDARSKRCRAAAWLEAGSKLSGLECGPRALRRPASRRLTGGDPGQQNSLYLLRSELASGRGS